MTRGLSGAGFDVDLREGQAREDALVHVFLRAKVEVKSDRRARTSGKVFIEFHDHQKAGGRGGPSGLNITAAHYWALEYDERCPNRAPQGARRSRGAGAWYGPRR